MTTQICTSAGGYETSTLDLLIRIEDLYLGGIRLASDQSNMEVHLKRWVPNNQILGSTVALSNGMNKMIFWQKERRCKISAGILKKRENTIAVQV